MLKKPEETIGYTLEKLQPPKAGQIITYVSIHCVSCEQLIDSVGGPRNNAVCLSCTKKLIGELPGQPFDI